jgi:hypothetical protein
MSVISSKVNCAVLFLNSFPKQKVFQVLPLPESRGGQWQPIS